MGKEVKGYANRLRRWRGRSVGASLEVGKGGAKLGDGRTTTAARGIVQAPERRKSAHVGLKSVNNHMGAGGDAHMNEGRGGRFEGLLILRTQIGALLDMCF